MKKINLILEQKENLDTVGEDLKIAVDTLNKYIDKKSYSIYVMPATDAEKIEKVKKKGSILIKLIESQGYKVDDLKDPEKVKKSIFLESFKEETEEASFIDSCFLTFLIKKENSDFRGYKSITFKSNNGGCVGLVDIASGAGSMLDIQLEKDFTLSLDGAIIQEEEAEENNGYTVNEIFDFMEDAWDNDYVLNK